MELKQLLTLVSLFILSVLAASGMRHFIYYYPKNVLRKWRQECVDFLNRNSEELIYRPAVEEDISLSNCPSCKKTISKWHMIASISLLMFRNHCENCQSRLSWRGISLEILCFLSGITLWLNFSFGAQFVFALVFCWTLILLAYIDLDYHLLLDNIVFPLLFIGLVVNLFSIFTSIQYAVLGCVIGFLVLYVPNKIYEVVRNAQSIGYGDIKLMAAIGAWLGIYSLFYIIIGSFLLAIVVYIVRNLYLKLSFKEPVPFGPCLAIMSALYLVLEV